MVCVKDLGGKLDLERERRRKRESVEIDWIGARSIPSDPIQVDQRRRGHDRRCHQIRSGTWLDPQCDITSFTNGLKSKLKQIMVRRVVLDFRFPSV